MTIIEKYVRIRKEIDETARQAQRDPASITLIAISKGQSVEKILSLYTIGVRDFGENRVNELLEKQRLLPPDIRWHFIGTLQANKINKVVGRCSLIHSVDSFSLAKKISDTALKHDVEQSVLLQVNISGETTKHGFTRNMLIDHFLECASLRAVHIRGLMTMAPRYAKSSSDEEEYVREIFMELEMLQKEVRTRYPVEGALCIELSMGMSQDFLVAVQTGATLLRVGSSIFSV